MPTSRNRRPLARNSSSMLSNLSLTEKIDNIAINIYQIWTFRDDIRFENLWFMSTLTELCACLCACVWVVHSFACFYASSRHIRFSLRRWTHQTVSCPDESPSGFAYVRKRERYDRWAWMKRFIDLERRKRAKAVKHKCLIPLMASVAPYDSLNSR